MARKSRLVLLDANVVIYLFELGIWDTVISRCDVYIASYIVEREALFYFDSSRCKVPIDLSAYQRQRRIAVFDVELVALKRFRDSFDLEYSESLDPGELNSLVYLVDHQNEDYMVCSGDKIVFRVLGNLRLSSKGISLEELLCELGLTRQVSSMFTRGFRERWTGDGFKDSMWRKGTRKKHT